MVVAEMPLTTRIKRRTDEPMTVVETEKGVGDRRVEGQEG